MKLRELFENTSIHRDIDIKGITNNSSEVRPGYLFVALKGNRSDSSQFIPDAINRGATVIVCERKNSRENRPDPIFLEVDSTKDIIWRLAKRFYGDPSSRVSVTGITGTNGKTTTSFLLRNILQVSGISTGRLGTIDYVIGDRKIPAVLTTPDILKVNQYLSQMELNGCSACVMEVSSHGLMQGRVEGINFKAAVYTNLGRDHLDYHKTIEDYLEAKTTLFRRLKRDSWAVVNIDDPYSEYILQNTLASVIGYGIRNVTSADIRYKLRARGISFSSSGMRFLISGFGETFSMETKLQGFHNVYNILAAAGAGLSYGASIDAVREGISITGDIPGRMERINLGQPFNVFIDYAHTPDALENVLNTLRDTAKARIILIFGCGGDRDKEKRPLMGRIAGRLADYSIITTDNPRGEDPGQIIKDIERGFVTNNYKTIPDRRDAIREAIETAQPQDVLLIAGKGHENYQILRHTVVPFSDRAVVEEFIRTYAGSVY